MTEFIWNGVGLTTPDAWEPSALERDGFLLEQSGVPLCELKWRTVDGRFRFDKHIKKLAKSNKGAEMRSVPNDETPEPWQDAIGALQESGIASQSFIWQSGAHRGIGAALHNAGTGLAALVQFFIVTEQAETVAAETLAYFRDYSAGKTIPWAMFGLKGRVPSSFVLDTFSFKPGHYSVKYWRPKSPKHTGKLPAGKGPGTALTFERYAPASVLLKGTSLAEWTTNTLEDVPDSAAVTSTDAVTWNEVAKTSLLRRTLRREVHASGMVWTTGEGNAILSVTAHGNVPMSESEFSTVHESYGLVQEI